MFCSPLFNKRFPSFSRGYVCGYSVNSATYASYMNIGQYLDHRQCSPGTTIRHQYNRHDRRARKIIGTTVVPIDTYVKHTKMNKKMC